jgi:hypothetical protein
MSERSWRSGAVARDGSSRRGFRWQNLRCCGFVLRRWDVTSAIAGRSVFQDALAGLYGLQLATRGFVLGGPNNAPTLNGVTPSQTSTSVAGINSAILQATTVTNTIAAGPTRWELARTAKERPRRCFRMAWF